jgi:hypothetical protein
MFMSTKVADSGRWVWVALPHPIVANLKPGPLPLCTSSPPTRRALTSQINTAQITSCIHTLIIMISVYILRHDRTEGGEEMPLTYLVISFL